MQNMASLPALLRALLSPRAYPHPAERVELVETHASWVLLAGERAYKVKKPVDFGFLDFSTLAARRRFCEEEVRLNRRLAPGLYLGVVAICGSEDAPMVGGDGPALEYAVAMRRFDEQARLDRVAARGGLERRHVDRLARDIARFHASAPTVGGGEPWGSASEVMTHALDNFRATRDGGAAAGLLTPELLRRLDALERWTRAEHARLAPTIEDRRAGGFVRECHGDLHLANMALIDDIVVPFDAREFSPGLRWTDVMAEVAFTVMDLHRLGQAGAARRFLNGWLEHSGDYAGLAVLPFYLAYRAMVRAKVAALRGGQIEEPAGRDAAARELAGAVALAGHFTEARERCLVITSGVSGSGKSRLAAALVEGGSWIRLRSDVERKRIAGLGPSERSGSETGTGLYAPAATEMTYRRLHALARTVLAAGYPVIVDATFLERRRRAAFRECAVEAGVPFAILAVDAPAALLESRVARRASAGTDASEATVDVLRRQLRDREPLDPTEAACTVRIDTSTDPDPTGTAARIAAITAREGSG